MIIGFKKACVVCNTKINCPDIRFSQKLIQKRQKEKESKREMSKGYMSSDTFSLSHTAHEASGV